MIKPPSMLLVVAALLVTLGVARGGHEMPVYPSYYPHEIAIETMPPERAADLLRDAKIQAYLRAEPRFPGAVPASPRAGGSPGSFVLARTTPVRSAQDERAACAVVEAILRDMAGKAGFVFHPYPVTPLHGDYLYHVDRAEAEKTRLLGAPAALPPRNLMVRAGGGMLASLVRPERRTQGQDWDAAVEEVDPAQLVAGARLSVNGWLGPVWVKAGWFHAQPILAHSTDDAEARRRA